jgi:hypothetical protein
MRVIAAPPRRIWDSAGGRTEEPLGRRAISAGPLPSRPISAPMASSNDGCSTATPVLHVAAFIICPSCLGLRYEARTAERGTTWELLHPLVFIALPARPVQIVLNSHSGFAAAALVRLVNAL